MFEPMTKEGQAFYTARRVSGLTRDELAERSGVPVWRIHKIEKGIKPATPEELRVLWCALSTGEVVPRPVEALPSRPSTKSLTVAAKKYPPAAVSLQAREARARRVARRQMKAKP
jgi:hypothetical protein